MTNRMFGHQRLALRKLTVTIGATIVWHYRILLRSLVVTQPKRVLLTSRPTSCLFGAMRYDYTVEAGLMDVESLRCATVPAMVRFLFRILFVDIQIAQRG